MKNICGFPQISAAKLHILYEIAACTVEKLCVSFGISVQLDLFQIVCEKLFGALAQSVKELVCFRVVHFGKRGA